MRKRPEKCEDDTKHEKTDDDEGQAAEQSSGKTNGV
jgi:hypothetical protein